MTTRLNKPDTEADKVMRACLDSNPPQSFVMVSGAGSGKTTSLIKALNHLVSKHGQTLRRRSQQIACITYTEGARDEIWADVAQSPLVHVSTIHSFMWHIAFPFQQDWRQWVSQRIDHKIAEHQATLAKPRAQSATKAKASKKIETLSAAKLRLPKSFRYGVGSDYLRGILGHDDIISGVPALILENELLQVIVGAQFPFILVDESQDTQVQVANALKAVVSKQPEKVCLGFFGDPMQRIYTTGIGDIPLADGWRRIEKEENFRCSAPVLAMINRIRADGDGLQQTLGGENRPGSARLLLIPQADEDKALTRARKWLADTTGKAEWMDESESNDFRVLVLLHGLAAKRLGFQGLYESLTKDAPDALRDGIMEGTAWPLSPFLNLVVPLVRAHRDNRQFAIMQVLRSHCPLLREGLPRDGAAVAKILSQLDADIDWLVQAFMPDSTVTIREVVERCRERQLVTADQRWEPFFGTVTPDAADLGFDADEEAAAKEHACVQRFLGCPAKETWGYWKYLEGESPFATQQSIKGAEFSRVLTLVDEEDRVHPQFSYGKLFGKVPPSETDEGHMAAGNDSVFGRTRRLFYVCCSRALEDLAVVLLSENVAATKTRLEALHLIPPEDIHILDHDLGTAI